MLFLSSGEEFKSAATFILWGISTTLLKQLEQLILIIYTFAMKSHHGISHLSQNVLMTPEICNMQYTIVVMDDVFGVILKVRLG